jgi:N6-L-threonylcarbamoyladenine synthase
MLILGIETSCDETAAAVVADGRTILSQVTLSQDLHKLYGGVVPELASREHTRTLVPVVRRAISEAKLSYEELEGIAVTNGPGLVGALLVGLSFAKALSYSLNKPLVGINHLEAHIFSVLVEHPELVPPFLCLVISGGHSNLYLVESLGRYRSIGSTRDDAAGEAFDKVAKLLGLGYPGGPAIDEVARSGNRDFVKFPKARMKGGGYDFSFSGLKTAVAIYVSKLDEEELQQRRADIAASFQEAVVAALLDNTIAAAQKHRMARIAVCGGVASNSRLRERVKAFSESQGVEVFYPSLELCTDNAAMVAAAGNFRLENFPPDDLELDAFPYLELGA